MWKKRKEGLSEEAGVRIPEPAAPQSGPEGINEVYVESVRKKVRRQITFTALLFSILFLCMTVYFCTYAFSRRRELFDNEYNTRSDLLEAHNLRGSIFADGGEELAYSDDDGNRFYPYYNLFCHAVGYAPMNGSGIERYMKYELLHSDIPFASKLECDRLDQLYPGNDVYTTLNVTMQQYCWDALGDLQGAVIVTEPSSGRILAMVSKPDFDPNAVEGMWEALRIDRSSKLLNRVTQGTYPPGSTFKIVDAIELLQEDPSAVYNFSFDCVDGVYEKDQESIHCFDYEHHHSQTLEQAFAHSCNSAFAKIVTEDLDLTRFRKTLKRLLFDSELPYDLPSSESSSQLLEEENISTHNLMQVAIGQGTTLVSPLHMNMITMAVANGGVLMRPYMIDRVCTAEDDILQSYSPCREGSMMDGETALQVRRLMRAVTTVTYDESTGQDVWGTASEFKDVQNYIPFGKTGTAEFGKEEDSHAWYTGFTVSAEDGEEGEAELCITVLIENGGVGSDKAVPIAKDILDKWYGEY